MDTPLTVEQVRAAGGYSVIYADPPWRYSDKNCNGGVEQHYSTMTLDQIMALRVSEIAARDAVLFLWATYPLYPEALKVISAWGFQYKSIAYQWLKIYSSMAPFFGLGRWTRGNTEPCLLAVRGKPKRVANDVSQLVFTGVDQHDQLVVAPVTRHSAKPPEVRTKIEQLMGPQAQIELFAREQAPGWDVWGNEVESSIILSGAA